MGQGNRGIIGIYWDRKVGEERIEERVVWCGVVYSKNRQDQEGREG
jgi:hypothetical protein